VPLLGRDPTSSASALTRRDLWAWTLHRAPPGTPVRLRVTLRASSELIHEKPASSTRRSRDAIRPRLRFGQPMPLVAEGLPTANFRSGELPMEWRRFVLITCAVTHRSAGCTRANATEPVRCTRCAPSLQKRAIPVPCRVLRPCERRVLSGHKFSRRSRSHGSSSSSDFVRGLLESLSCPPAPLLLALYRPSVHYHFAHSSSAVSKSHASSRSSFSSPGAISGLASPRPTSSLRCSPLPSRTPTPHQGHLARVVCQ